MALLGLLVLLLVDACVSRSVPVYETNGLLVDRLRDAERDHLRDCPCGGPELSSLCLPVAFGARRDATEEPKREVFAFSVATDDRWKQYDWEQLTTVAWNEDKELLCHAHSKGVKVVVKHNFDEVEQLCNATARRDWVQATYAKIVKNYADGVNIDTEKPMNGTTAQCLALLVQELRRELELHPLTTSAQVTFDVPWAPRGVDGRYYPWRELAAASDFLIVMSYDMRSQVYDACVAGANSPWALVKQGLQEFLLGQGVSPHKLVLGVPWYGYNYSCLSTDDAWCQIRPVPFFGAPCSDAAGGQVDYGVIRRLARRHGLTARWDPMSETPYLALQRSQIWFDDVRSLRKKYKLAKELGLRGVGMWNADTLDYSAKEDAQQMWQALHDAFE